jgi:hypothetical protein
MLLARCEADVEIPGAEVALFELEGGREVVETSINTFRMIRFPSTVYQQSARQLKLGARGGWPPTPLSMTTSGGVDGTSLSILSLLATKTSMLASQ